MSDKEIIRFDGRVVVITGSARGLGRTYAFDFASRGARVVINDIDKSLVDQTVKDINEKGYHLPNITAIPDYHNCANEDWQNVHDVHLKGAFLTTNTAWKYMRQQKYGRIIFTSSASGIYGNMGQANYSAAKAGLVGLGKTLALEGQRFNIIVNVIIPIAGTRMSATVLPQDIVKKLKPEYVSPAVLYLCSDKVRESGQLLEVGGGWYGKVKVVRAPGIHLLKQKQQGLITPETIAQNWDKISDFSGNISSPSGATEALMPILEIISNQSVTGKYKGIEEASKDLQQSNQLLGSESKERGEKQKKKKDLSAFKSSIVFDRMASILNNELVEKIGAIFEFRLKNADINLVKSWIVDLKNKPGWLYAIDVDDVEKPKVDCVVQTTDETFTNLVKGKISAEYALVSEKLKVKGQMQYVMKLSMLLNLLNQSSIDNNAMSKL